MDRVPCIPRGRFSEYMKKITDTIIELNTLGARLPHDYIVIRICGDKPNSWYEVKIEIEQPLSSPACINPEKDRKKAHGLITKCLSKLRELGVVLPSFVFVSICDILPASYREAKMVIQ